MRRLVLLALALAALAVPASAGAGGWHYTFQDFFDAGPGTIASGVAKAKKCSGGKLGIYNYRSFAQASGGDFEFEVEVLAKLSVREKWGRMKDVEVSAQGSPSIPPDVVQDVAEGLQDFHETVFTRWKPGKLEVKHGALVISGNEVFEPGESKTPFHPKPGC